MVLTPELKSQLKEHALSDTTKECCGLFVNDGKYIPLQNESKNPSESFVIELASIREIENKQNIIGIFHSHLDGTFSGVDKHISEIKKIPSIIYKIKEDEFEIYEPIGLEIPYCGRSYAIGIFDCFTLIQDYYKRELNINISNVDYKFRYSMNFSEIEDNTPDNKVTINHLLQNGFSEVKNLKKHDIILSRCPKIKFGVHYSIYLENNKVLHQYMEEPSSIDDYDSVQKKLTVGFFRHATNL